MLTSDYRFDTPLKMVVLYIAYTVYKKSNLTVNYHNSK